MGTYVFSYASAAYTFTTAIYLVEIISSYSKSINDLPACTVAPFGVPCNLLVSVVHWQRVPGAIMESG